MLVGMFWRASPASFGSCGKHLIMEIGSNNEMASVPTELHPLSIYQYYPRLSFTPSKAFEDSSEMKAVTTCFKSIEHDIFKDQSYTVQRGQKKSISEVMTLDKSIKEWPKIPEVFFFLFGGLMRQGASCKTFSNGPAQRSSPSVTLGDVGLMVIRKCSSLEGNHFCPPPMFSIVLPFGCSTCHAEPQHNSETHSSDESASQCTFSKTSRMFRFSICLFMFEPGIRIACAITGLAYPADMDMPLDADVETRADGSLSSQANVTAVPLRPARPQRPMRCT